MANGLTFGLFHLFITVPIIFAFMVGACYLGTTYALRSYFEGEDPPSSFIGIDDDKKSR